MNELAICSGVGMLSEGLRAACEFFGLEHRAVCHVEREAPAAGQLVALMEAGAIDPAPIWSDLLTFDGSAWRGKVDCITAGFPCQPHSMAGKRKGTEDERWIWPAIGTIIRDISPRLVFLENVRGLLSSGGFEACLGSLACMGFDVKWGVLQAAEVRANHQRERTFILAYRKGERLGKEGRDSERSTQWAGGRGAALGLTACELLNRNGASAEQDWRAKPANAGGVVGHADSARPQGWSIELGERAREWIAGSPSHQLFAPGPLSDRWAGIIANDPHLAPAVEPGLRMLVNGVAYVVDESRADQLRQVGNGVVALQAAAAFIQLARRAELV